MTLSTSVIEIDIRGMDEKHARAEFDWVGGASFGRHVRVHVGVTMPPTWHSGLLRPDIVWQFVADDERTLSAWEEAARYDETHHDPTRNGREIPQEALA